MTNLEELYPKIQAGFLIDLASRGLRVDERGLDEYRPIKIETGIFEKAEGSAKVSLGGTQVLVGIKMDVDRPFPDTPDRGILITNAELVPTASPVFEPGPPDENAIELARVVDRALRESEAVPFEDLVIEEGKEVWMIFVDIHVVDYDGNLIDASLLGAVAALMTAKIPEDKFGYSDEPRPLKLNCIPTSTTFVKIGDYWFIDPSLPEEQLADLRLSIAMNEKGIISSVQKSGRGSIKFEETEKIIKKAKLKTTELRKILLKSIGVNKNVKKD